MHQSRRRMDDKTRVMSIASYECGGLESVFRAILRAPDWNTRLLQAFRHFLVKHVGFDSDPEQGHGLLIGMSRLIIGCELSGRSFAIC